MTKKSIPRPMLSTAVPAGFPSPADDYIENHINLNEYLIAHPEATFYMRVVGDSMEGAGIFEEDILIIDRAISPLSGHIVIAVVDGEFTVKRYIVEQELPILRAENTAYADILLNNEQELYVWGVVRFTIHKVI